MNEAETRAELVDTALREAGWGVVDGSRVRREAPIAPGRIEGAGRKAKPLAADYVLVFRNRNLAVVEAKAEEKAITEGLGQAKDYARKLAVRFAYATNGHGIYAVDMQTGHESTVPHYPSPEELWNQTFAEPNEWRNRFAAIAYEDKGGSHPGRYYQEIAIERVLDAIAAGKNRILLTLATGTGKTFIAFQVAWKLFQSRWSLLREPTRRPRILFLADRNILADQAYNAFSAFAEDARMRIAPEEIRKAGRVPKNASIFFTIFQTFMSGPPKHGQPSPYFGEYPPDFFDFIIIDECHRGGAQDESTWRQILEYFQPAVQLGLTATPKRQENADTYAYFGHPVFTYSLKDGINDGFLTPFKVKEIETTIDDYVYTSDDDVIEGEIERGKRYTEGDFNRTIEIDERERYRVKLLLDQIDPREKTLVFCATQDHARRVRDIVNQLKASPEPNYCERVTASDGALGDRWLREFQDNEKTIPTILTTSQKLSTGVDARNVRNIVLMRPIKSMIEFKQIIGRGTRLYDGKAYFTIYDYVKAHQHFQDKEWDGEPPEPPPASSSSTPKLPPVVLAKKDSDRPPREKVRVKLSDGKVRSLDSMMCTTYWHADGTPLSSEEFMHLLYGKLPQFFGSAAELRSIWIEPERRKKLLDDLAAAGFGHERLAEMQRILGAEEGETYDMLAHVAYATPPRTRQERAEQAKQAIRGQYSEQQQAFLAFVLEHYVQEGVEELGGEKLTPLLMLRYHDSIGDALADLGPAAEVRRIFIEFQRHLYEEAKAG